METSKKRNTKYVGDLSELAAIKAFIENGYRVAIPFGENNRYDLIVERDNTLSRVQVKTGRLRRGAILFNCYSSHSHRGGGARTYAGEVEYFAVYCTETDQVYLIPLSDMAMWSGTLRVETPRNGQDKKVRWAARYLLSGGRDAPRSWSIGPVQLEMPS